MAHPRRRSPRTVLGLAMVWALVGVSVSSTAQAATVFSDGFESGTTSAWTKVRAFTAQQTTVATGSWAGRAVSTGKPAWAWRDLGTGLGEAYLRSLVHITSRSTAVWFAYARTSTGSGIAAVGVNKNGVLIVRDLVSKTTYSGAVSVSSGSWHEVELHVLTGTSGRIDVWLDGQPVSALSRSVNLGTAAVGRVMVGDASSKRTFDVAFDDVVVATTRVGVTDSTPPSTPTDLTAAAVGSSRIDLAWQASTDDVGVAGYTVSRWDGASFVTVATSASTSYSDTGLSPETTYTYVVEAFDAAGNRSEPSAPASATTGPRGPMPANIVVIVTDDQPWDTMDRMSTVSSELVGMGVTFTNGIVSHPLCCPARVSILRGQYAHTTGIYDIDGTYGGFQRVRDTDLESSMLGPWLQGAGYRTALVGKYLNGYTGTQSPPPGWDYWRGASSSYYGYTVNENGVAKKYGSAQEDYQTLVLSRYADEFIRTTSGDVPLFLYVAPLAPHAPFTAEPKYEDDARCADATNTDAPSFNEADVSDKPAYIRDRKLVNVQEYGYDRPRDQCETLLSVDDLVARVLTALEDTGRLSTTLIAFTSDNGFMNGEHRWTTKRAPYEGSVRVPFVVRYDPLTQDVPQIDDSLVANVDIAPTAMELAGISMDPGCPTPPFGGVCDGRVEGSSLMPLLDGSASGWRDAVLLEHWKDPQKSHPIPTYCGVRTATHKFVRHATGEEELYDLIADPDEMVNLLGDGGVTAEEQIVRDALFQRLFGADGLCSPPPPDYPLP